jgi:hypothetical protein
MLSIVSKIQESFAGKDENQKGLHFNFIKDKDAMLHALSKSQEKGTLIGVYAKELGEGMFLTGVDKIESVGTQKIIVFETYEIYGKILNRTRVALDEIKMVCPFQIEYVNPLLGNAKK